VIREVAQLQSICVAPSASPLIVLPHWGADYSDVAATFENAMLDKMADCGVSAVIGAHSHRASTKIDLRASGGLQSIFSMGNLIFDQTGTDVSGSLVELRVFRQGTMALRIIPIPNFFEEVKAPRP
jgi:poly-gamma-glutamate synthesis protein (capsule biosynthesis protein)